MIREDLKEDIEGLKRDVGGCGRASEFEGVAEMMRATEWAAAGRSQPDFVLLEKYICTGYNNRLWSSGGNEAVTVKSIILCIIG